MHMKGPVLYFAFPLLRVFVQVRDMPLMNFDIYSTTLIREKINHIPLVNIRPQKSKGCIQLDVFKKAPMKSINCSREGLTLLSQPLEARTKCKFDL